MKVLFFGNIGSGKSTVISKLKSIFPFEVSAIDDFRRKYGDGSRSNELVARSNFLSTIKEFKNQFIECIGVGQVADELVHLIQEFKEPIICLLLLTPKEICKLRLEDRVWDIPFPAPTDSVFSLIERVDIEINNNGIFKKWQRNENFYFITKPNASESDLITIISDMTRIIHDFMAISNEEINDIKMMASTIAQDYYGKKYLTYQKAILEKNHDFVNDRKMISLFISEADIVGNIMDIGSGYCQWFPILKEKIEHYYAIDLNENALSEAPKCDKLTALKLDIFSPQVNVEDYIKTSIDTAIFSFFLSHFSNETINSLFKKLKHINSILIIDSFWGKDHQKKYATKDLRIIHRSTSESEEILLPKRFFDRSDIEDLLNTHGYKISSFKNGIYWFAAIASRPAFSL